MRRFTNVKGFKIFEVSAAEVRAIEAVLVYVIVAISILT